MTVPISGPDSPSALPVSVTASGRTSAVAGPSGVSGCTSGMLAPRTSTAPPRTVPAILLVRPTKSATNGVAGRE